MEYNTTRSHLILPEYGRNVQNMIGHAMSIADKDERNRAARAIIEVMGQLNPHLRDVDDYRHKLWTHLFVMSDFKLDVDSPYEIPEMEALIEKPQLMTYPKARIRYGHYGKYTETILKTSTEFVKDDEKEYLVRNMGNFMKKQFLTYNNDAVENHVIADQMLELSKGHLELANPDELVSTSSVLKAIGSVRQQNSTNHSNRGKKNNNNKKNIRKKK